MTVPPALKPPLIVAESVTVEPTRGDKLERLVEIEGLTLPTEIAIDIECDRDPLVPESVTVNVPLTEDGQDIVEVPEPARLVGESVQESPVDGDEVAAKVTFPAKPLTPDIVTVEFPALPTVTLTVEGLAEMVKSWTMKVTIVECDFDPLVPVIVTWRVPAAAKVQASVEVPDPVTLVGLSVQAVLLLARLTIPANPFNVVTVIADVAPVPAFAVTLIGLAAIVKSWTTYVIVTEWVRPGLEPVTPTCRVEAAVKVQERVALPEPLTLVGATLQDVLLVVRLTTPANPFNPVIVIDELPDALALTVTVVGLAAIAKSCTVYVKVAEWERVPLVPVTVTV
jgi:hypothetical protein